MDDFDYDDYEGKTPFKLRLKNGDRIGIHCSRKLTRIVKFSAASILPIEPLTLW